MLGICGSGLAPLISRTDMVGWGIRTEVDMAYSVTVTTIDAASVVTWEDGHVQVSDSPIAGTIQSYLARKHEFPVGDKPEPGCTAGFTIERRRIGSDFEIASVLMQLPYETKLDCDVDVQPRIYTSREGFSVDEDGNISDAGFHAELLGDDD